MSTVITMAFPNLIPEPVRVADHQVMSAASTNTLAINTALGIGFLIANIVGVVALYLFKPWARPLNIAIAASIFIIWPVLGYNVISGWAQAFSDFSSFLWGAVLAISYLPPIREWFTNAKR